MKQSSCSHKNNSHLHCFITTTNVCLVDKDIRNGLLPGHLQQHVLVVGSIIWTEGLTLFINLIYINVDSTIFLKRYI